MIKGKIDKMPVMNCTGIETMPHDNIHIATHLKEVKV